MYSLEKYRHLSFRPLFTRYNCSWLVPRKMGRPLLGSRPNQGQITPQPKSHSFFCRKTTFSPLFLFIISSHKLEGEGTLLSYMATAK